MRWSTFVSLLTHWFAWQRRYHHLGGCILQLLHLLLLDIGDELMYRTCIVDSSIGESHRDILSLKLHVHLGRHIESLGALWVATARGLVRLKAKALHLYSFLTRRRQEWLLLASGRPLIHQYWRALSTTCWLLLADEVWHLLRAIRRIIGEASRLIVLIVELRCCLKSWSCIIELQVTF